MINIANYVDTEQLSSVGISNIEMWLFSAEFPASAGSKFVSSTGLAALARRLDV